MPSVVQPAASAFETAFARDSSARTEHSGFATLCSDSGSGSGSKSGRGLRIAAPGLSLAAAGPLLGPAAKLSGQLSSTRSFEASRSGAPALIANAILEGSRSTSLRNSTSGGRRCHLRTSPAPHDLTGSRDLSKYRFSFFSATVRQAGGLVRAWIRLPRANGGTAAARSHRTSAACL